MVFAALDAAIPKFNDGVDSGMNRAHATNVSFKVATSVFGPLFYSVD